MTLVVTLLTLESDLQMKRVILYCFCLLRVMTLHLTLTKVVGTASGLVLQRVGTRCCFGAGPGVRHCPLAATSGRFPQETETIHRCLVRTEAIVPVSVCRTSYALHHRPVIPQGPRYPERFSPEGSGTQREGWGTLPGDSPL